MMTTLETYITVHDQDCLLECERVDQFVHLSSYTYLFVGPRPTDRVPPDVKIVVARDYEPNYEHLPQFYDFTGWWILAAHDLVEADHVMFMQYDMTITTSFLEDQVNYLLEVGRGPVAFTAGHNDAGNFMLNLEGFEAAYDHGLASVGQSRGWWPPFNEWPSTQGTAWRTSDFIDFMKWFEPLFCVWHDNIWAGHLAERTVKAWAVLNAPERYLPGVIIHQARDCHGTCALMAGNQATYAERAATFGR